MLRQQRRVDVYHPARRDVQHLLREDLAEGRRDHHVRLKRAQLRHALMPADLLKLKHRTAALQRPSLDRAGGQPVAATHGAIRLREYADHLIACVQQRVQRGHRELRRAHKYDLRHAHSPFLTWR